MKKNKLKTEEIVKRLEFLWFEDFGKKGIESCVFLS